MKYILFLVAPLLMFSCKKNPAGQKPSTKDFASAQAINSRLGKGIDISTFEADQSWQAPFDTSYFRIIAGLGFTHVRLPIKWERTDRSMGNYPYTIYPAFLSTVKTAVDAALRNKLHIIINMHHHDALMTYFSGMSPARDVPHV